MQKNCRATILFKKELFLIDHFGGLSTKNDTMHMKNLSLPEWLTNKQPKYTFHAE